MLKSISDLAISICSFFRAILFDNKKLLLLQILRRSTKRAKAIKQSSSDLNSVDPNIFSWKIQSDKLARIERRGGWKKSNDQRRQSVSPQEGAAERTSRLSFGRNSTLTFYLQGKKGLVFPKMKKKKNRNPEMKWEGNDLSTLHTVQRIYSVTSYVLLRIFTTLPLWLTNVLDARLFLH